LPEHALIEFASIIVLGIIAQWLAWRFQLPSILFLLIMGFLAGPVSGFLHPDRLMGDLLLPVVSISVAVILFEGGLTLRLGELKDIGKVVLSLITLGALVTWAIISAAAYYWLHYNIRLAILLGAVLIVTGPTVIGPLLQHIRPLKNVANILKWEGILIDPVGAVLAVLVFEALFFTNGSHFGLLLILGIVKTIIFGTLTGYLAARFLVLLLKRFWLPDFLQEPVSLILLIIAYVLSNALQAESGLLAVTIMGLALDNQKQVNIKHIVEFKENLRVIIISSLFILLSARLRLEDFTSFNIEMALFLLAIFFIARPLSVLIATFNSELKWRERLFLSWMAPRGIVAASVVSVFAFELADKNVPQAETLVPVVFTVIVATVTIYGLTSVPLARWLKIALKNPQGVLILGAHSWARAIAKAILEHDFNVLLVDTNHAKTAKAHMEGLPAVNANIISEHIINDLDLNGIGRLLALTSNDEANALAVLNLDDIFERQELYQLPLNAQAKADDRPTHLRGRFLFGEAVTFDHLNNLYLQGWQLKSTKLSEQFDFEQFKNQYNQHVIPMFLINHTGHLQIFTIDRPLKPVAGQTVIALVHPNEEQCKPAV